MWRRSVGALCAVVALAVVPSCNTTVPSSDSMPPDLTLRYRVGDAEWASITAGGEISAAEGETIYFWALAEDDGGVAEVTLHAEGKVQFGRIDAPATIRLESASFDAVNEAEPDIAPGDSAWASRMTLLDYVSSDSPPPDGHFFQTARLTITAQAKDFHGNTANSGDVDLTVD